MSSTSRDIVAAVVNDHEDVEALLRHLADPETVVGPVLLALRLLLESHWYAEHETLWGLQDDAFAELTALRDEDVDEEVRSLIDHLEVLSCTSEVFAAVLAELSDILADHIEVFESRLAVQIEESLSAARRRQLGSRFARSKQEFIETVQVGTQVVRKQRYPRLRSLR